MCKTRSLLDTILDITLLKATLEYVPLYRSFAVITFENKSGNGNFMAIRADNCSTAVLVDAADQRGIFITNGEFASFEVVGMIFVQSW